MMYFTVVYIDTQIQFLLRLECHIFRPNSSLSKLVLDAVDGNQLCLKDCLSTLAPFTTLLTKVYVLKTLFAGIGPMPLLPYPYSG